MIISAFPYQSIIRKSLINIRFFLICEVINISNNIVENFTDFLFIVFCDSCNY